MKVVIQRCKHGSVSVDNNVINEINKGYVILVGINVSDTIDDVNYLVRKTLNLRVFDDENGVMNRSVVDVDGEILVVSQFTLHAMTRKGNRPSYIKAAKHEIAIPLYEDFCHKLSIKLGREVKTGTFAADMNVALVNNGPVTIWIDSKNKE